MKEIKIKNSNKIFWPEEQYTKGDLINYYQQVAKYILPHLVDRPESLNRFPDGIYGENFYQKNYSDKLPEDIEAVEIESEGDGKTTRYILCQNAKTLLFLTNLGCIEMNPWLSRISNLDKPDFLVLDLDPEDIEFQKVIETAQVIHELLDYFKIPNYCKTSGATGLHIYIPLGGKYTYDQSRQFGKILATIVNRRIPSFTSLERSPKKRQHKVYIDYLQNSRGQTIAAPYSVRPVEKAKVSTPLNWSEVNSKLSPDLFTIKNVSERLNQLGDIFAPVLNESINIPEILKSF
jgi:bifunctional non-homologous end joining protein LigD